jgi:hypothetical protein
MNKEIKIIIEELGAEFTTNSPLETYAFTTAVLDHNFDSGTAQELAKLSRLIYIDTNYNIAPVELIWYLCTEYNNLPNDYNDLLNVFANDYGIDLELIRKWT